MVIDDRFYLKLAIDEAWKYQLLTYPNPAVAALITDKNGKIISLEAHQKAGDSHAEVLASTSAIIHLENDLVLKEIDSPIDRYHYLVENYRGYFKGFSIYITLEPCNHTGKTPPCSQLLKELGFSRVIYAQSDNGAKSSGGAHLLKEASTKVIKLEDEEIQNASGQLLEPFLSWQNDRFIFFKMAMSVNGAYKGGIISSYKSRELVHRIRDKIDLLVIGGESVRVDRPTLDSRYIGGKAPDILILSNREEFDETIPLFHVPDRKVYIQNSLDMVKNYNFVMIEGGERMLESVKDIVDWVMIFRASYFKEKEASDIEKVAMQCLKVLRYNDDNIEWYKIIK